MVHILYIVDVCVGVLLALAIAYAFKLSNKGIRMLLDYSERFSIAVEAKANVDGIVARVMEGEKEEKEENED